ncbi:hypothetical protein OHA25_60635 (plasmid) [Nonomuraea sp. NBC_00507]|uniref:hypothetical protein n=1 Tax=Nonomuraea sp. NBC_00507 TaxID=2976002 RepID=UPI002E18F03E
MTTKAAHDDVLALTRRVTRFGTSYARTRVTVASETQIRTLEAMCRLAGRRPSALVSDIVRRAIHAAWSRREVLEAIAELALARHAGAGPACWLCGCTDESACPGNCHWVRDPLMLGDLCSSCQDIVLLLSAGLDGRQPGLAPAGTWPSRNPLVDPPQGFESQGLHLYDSEDGASLFTFGHVSTERMVAAVADYVRGTQFGPGAVVKDPLASLVGGAERVRLSICYGYATYDPAPCGFGEFSAELFVDPCSDGAVPITYWKGAETRPELPQGSHLVGSRDGITHAIARADALRGVDSGGDRLWTACLGFADLIAGAGAFDAAALRHPAPCPACERRDDPWKACRRHTVCAKCAWAVALQAGPEAIERELQAITPAGDDPKALPIPDPLIARRLCEAILAAENAATGQLEVTRPHDRGLIELLAAVTQHAPAVRPADHTADEPLWAIAGCAACTLSIGDQARRLRTRASKEECVVAAPCSVLAALVERFLTSSHTNT